MDPTTLELPPFPTMEWDDCEWWDGEISLTFGERVGLTVTPYDLGASRLPTFTQGQALTYHMQNGDQVFAAVLDALLPYYQRMRPKYVEYLGDDVDQLMPALDKAEGLKQLVDLRQVHVPPWQNSGVGYVGLQFGCTWDVEHGLGLLMHKDRVVQLGGADVSFAFKPELADNP